MNGRELVRDPGGLVDDDGPLPRLTRPYVLPDFDEPMRAQLVDLGRALPATPEPSGRHRVYSTSTGDGWVIGRAPAVRPAQPGPQPTDADPPDWYGPTESADVRGPHAPGLRRFSRRVRTRVSRYSRLSVTAAVALVVGVNLAAITVIVRNATHPPARHASSNTAPGAQESMTGDDQADPAGIAVPTDVATTPQLTIPDLPSSSVTPSQTPAGVLPAPGAGQSATATVPVATAPPPQTGRVSAYAVIEAEDFGAQNNTKLESGVDGGVSETHVGFIANGDWLEYPGVNFTSSAATQFRSRVASGVANGFVGRVEVHVDSRSNAPIGSFSIGATASGQAGWQTWRTVSTPVAPVTGVHTVYLTFAANHDREFLNINWFTFVH